MYHFKTLYKNNGAFSQLNQKLDSKHEIGNINNEDVGNGRQAARFMFAALCRAMCVREGLSERG